MTPLAVILTSDKSVLYVLGSVLCVSLGISAIWIAASNRHFRGWALAAALVLMGGAIACLLAAGRDAFAVMMVIVGVALASALGSVALRWEIDNALARRWTSVPPSRHGVVLMNPKSGDGKVSRLRLADEAHRRGLEVVELLDGDDLGALAEAAVSRGADVIGMAGGDGSQAVVAAVAAEHGLASVCVPAGTRNHLALDLGIDRDDRECSGCPRTGTRIDHRPG